MKKHLTLSLAALLALGGMLKADEAAKEEAKEAPAAVAKNDAPGSLKAGNLLLDEGKYEEAIAYFEGIGEQSSAKREPFRLLGLSTALVEAGKYEAAIEAANKAIAAKKDLSGAWNNLAAAYVRSGQRDKAVETYTSAIEAIKSAGGDSAKMEKNLAEIQNAIEMSKPKKVREAEAKAKAEAEKAAATTTEEKK